MVSHQCSCQDEVSGRPDYSLWVVLRSYLCEDLTSSKPRGPLRDQIIALGNQELARRTVVPAEEGADEKDAEPKVAEGDAPLIRIYNFLRAYCPLYHEVRETEEG